MLSFKRILLAIVFCGTLGLSAISQQTQPVEQVCDPATATAAPAEGNCHYNCGAFCPPWERQQNVQPGRCVDGELRCKPKNSPTTLTLHWYDCVVNFNVTCSGTQVACKWQVDSSSGHNAEVSDCTNL